MIRDIYWKIMWFIALFLAGIGCAASIIHFHSLKLLDLETIEGGQFEVRRIGGELQDYYEVYGADFRYIDANVLIAESDVVICVEALPAYNVLPTSIDREVTVTRIIKGDVERGTTIHVIEPSFILIYSNGDYSGRAFMGYSPMLPYETYLLFLNREHEDAYTINYLAFGKYSLDFESEYRLLDWQQEYMYADIRNDDLLTSDPALYETYITLYKDICETLNLTTPYISYMEKTHSKQLYI